jgi:hypothetical protein
MEDIEANVNCVWLTRSRKALIYRKRGRGNTKRVHRHSHAMLCGEGTRCSKLIISDYSSD